MSINVKQFKDVVITPATMALGLYSPSATVLLLGTCAQESHMGEFLVQKGIGFKGGIGIFQMEKRSYDDVWDRLVSGNTALKAKMRLFLGYEGKPLAERMATDLGLACVMARLYYYNINQPLPPADDLPAIARYWKHWYNTALGRGTEQEFLDNYARLVAKDL